MRKGEISILASGGDHGPVGAHQSQGQAAKNLAGHLAFLHPLAPRQCSRQLSHLGNSTRVKSAKSFNREGQEDDALKAASFCRVLDFPLVGLWDKSFDLNISKHTERPCTGKQKASRVTSGFVELIIQLSQVRLSRKVGFHRCNIKNAEFWAEMPFFGGGGCQ